MSHPVQKGKQIAFEAGIFKGFILTGYDFPRFRPKSGACCIFPVKWCLVKKVITVNTSL